MNETGMSNPPEPVRKIRADAAERAEKAWRARVLGASWTDAARVAGLSSAEAAMRAVRNAFDELPVVDRDEQRGVWRDRLEVLWRQALKDVHEQRPGALLAAVRLADRAARLDGLDEPARFSVTPSDGELQAFINSVFEAQAAHLPVEADLFADVIDGDVVNDLTT